MIVAPQVARTADSDLARAPGPSASFRAVSIAVHRNTMQGGASSAASNENISPKVMIRVMSELKELQKSPIDVVSNIFAFDHVERCEILIKFLDHIVSDPFWRINLMSTVKVLDSCRARLDGRVASIRLCSNAKPQCNPRFGVSTGLD